MILFHPEWDFLCVIVSRQHFFIPCRLSLCYQLSSVDNIFILYSRTFDVLLSIESILFLTVGFSLCYLTVDSIILQCTVSLCYLQKTAFSQCYHQKIILYSLWYRELSLCYLQQIAFYSSLQICTVLSSVDSILFLTEELSQSYHQQTAFNSLLWNHFYSLLYTLSITIVPTLLAQAIRGSQDNLA